MAKWMKEAFAHNKGGLHRATHTPEGETIPLYKIEKAAHSSDPHVRHMAAAGRTGGKIARKHAMPSGRRR